MREKIIYTGPIHKIYADNIGLKDNKVIVEIRDRKIIDVSSFYTIGTRFMNMEYDNILPTKDEAESYLYSVIDKRKDKIIKILTSNDIPYERKIELLEIIKNSSSCVYVDVSELKASFTLNNEQFKIYKKDMKVK